MRHRTIHFFGRVLHFFSWLETLVILFDVFVLREYSFKTDKKSPVILDCGSHIGVSVLGHKKMYPGAKIIAFEPNPSTFSLLEKNIQANGLKGVKVINAALSDKKSSAFFYSDNTKQSRKAWEDTLIKNWFRDKRKQIRSVVRVVKLSSYINGPIDFIKMDIEGSEADVLKEIQEKLPLVGEIVFEFHSIPEDENLSSPDEVMKMLEDNSFDCAVERKLYNRGRPLYIIRAKNKKHKT